MGQAKSKSAEEQPADEFGEFVAALRKVVISAFILWQLLMVFFWLMPKSAIQEAMLAPLRHYMWLSGNDQNWNMFSPNPANVDVYMQAQITYQNGTTKTWLFPRMHNLGLVEKYQKERFRKLIENAHLDANSAVWPYVANYAAYINNKEPKTNPVVHVELIRTWLEIPPPPYALPHYTSYTFYRKDYSAGSPI